jgi:predicted SAM-dependent methyltransferase
MKKLNFGCGTRFAKGWTNIDVYAAGPEVQRVNLLKRFPFPDEHFDAVYSSHVIEHFTPPQADHLISEACRVLKPGGILRTVVPDLEATCREYLRVLDAATPSHTPKEYEWIVMELLDQLTRSTPSGEMWPYFQRLAASQDAELKAYVASRTEYAASGSAPKKTFRERLRGLLPKKIYNKLFYLYLGLVSRLFPRHIRSQVIVLTGLGERHRWMYDRVGLQRLLQKHGFEETTIHRADTSSIPDFREDHLDIEPDGTPYKRVSLYMEAVKPRQG